VRYASQLSNGRLNQLLLALLEGPCLCHEKREGIQGTVVSVLASTMQIRTTNAGVMLSAEMA